MFGGKILGLDIGTKTTKLVLLKPGRKPAVLKSAVVPTPAESIRDGEIKDVESISALVKKAIEENRMKTAKLSICINSPHAVVREMKLPALKDSEIRPAVEFELSQTFPDIARTHSISFKVYARTSDSINGIVAFCPNKIVEGYISLAQNIKIPLKYLDVSANCITKAYNSFVKLPDSGDAVLIVDIGCNNSLVNIITGGKLLLSRLVSSGGASVDNIIANRFGISRQQAEQDKLAKYMGYDLGQDDIDTCIRLGYAAIEEQVRQTIDFYTYNKFREGIKNIFLTGGGSLFPELERYFYETFRIPTSIIKPLDGDAAGGEEFAGLMLAIGAALRED